MPEAGPVVANTTPLISLAIIGQFALLRRLYGTVAIPEAVRAEIEAGGRGSPGYDGRKAWATARGSHLLMDFS